MASDYSDKLATKTRDIKMESAFRRWAIEFLAHLLDEGTEREELSSSTTYLLVEGIEFEDISDPNLFFSQHPELSGLRTTSAYLKIQTLARTFGLYLTPATNGVLADMLANSPMEDKKMLLSALQYHCQALGLPRLTCKALGAVIAEGLPRKELRASMWDYQVALGNVIDYKGGK